jgi:hypothetical protein
MTCIGLILFVLITAPAEQDIDRTFGAQASEKLRGRAERCVGHFRRRSAFI